MSSKTLKSRINKFIFKDGKVFLRIKTKAENLIVKKNSINYEMIFPTPSDNQQFTSIPVVWINDFDKDKILSKETLFLDHEEDSLKDSILETEENWGALTAFKNSKSKMNYYYLSPKNKPYAIKIGPIHDSIDGKEIEFDWSNLQLGDSES